MQIPWYFALLYGYVLSLVAGGLLVHCFNTFMKSQVGDDPKTQSRLSSDITGFLERFVFTALMFAQPEGAPVAMGGWLALKMAASWQRDIGLEYPDDPERTRLGRLHWASHAFLGLQTGFVSMSFAGGGRNARPLVCGLTSTFVTKFRALLRESLQLLRLPVAKMAASPTRFRFHTFAKQFSRCLPL